MGDRQSRVEALRQPALASLSPPDQKRALRVRQSNLAIVNLPAPLGWGSMSDLPQPEPPYHLFLDTDEVPVAASALRLFISDEAHEPRIQRLGHEVLAALQEPADERGTLTVTLAPEQMKITHSAVRLLLNDLQREQDNERQLLHAILEKLPDEHTMRAIELE